MTDKDTDPAGASDPGDVDVCGQTPAGPGSEVRSGIQIGGLDGAAVQEATSAVARYEVSG